MKARWFLVVGIIVFLVGSVSFAQTWSAEQKEVLATVDGAFKAVMERDTEAVKGVFSPNYRGWHVDSGDPGPKTLEQVMPWMEHSFARNKMELYTLHPLAIDVHGDTAVVFYVVDLLYAMDESNEVRKAVKMMDVYQKQDGKWLLIADFTE